MQGLTMGKHLHVYSEFTLGGLLKRDEQFLLRSAARTVGALPNAESWL